MAVRAVRGATQVEANDRELVLQATTELVTEMMIRNDVVVDDVISVLFTTTPDLTAEFPAVAARKAGFEEVPLLCASEIDVPGALPRVIRLMAYIDINRSRGEIKHVYLRGASVLRRNFAQ
jgi:chorismate mutase